MAGLLIDPIGTLLSGLASMAPYVIVAGLVVGSYFYGDHVGTSACQASQLQVIIDQQNAKIKELEQQYQNAETTVNGLDTTIAADNAVIASDKKNLATVLTTTGTCDQSSALINLLNGARK